MSGCARSHSQFPGSILHEGPAGLPALETVCFNLLGWLCFISSQGVGGASAERKALLSTVGRGRWEDFMSS